MTPSYSVELLFDLAEQTELRVTGHVYLPERAIGGDHWSGWRDGPHYALVRGKEEVGVSEELALDLAYAEISSSRETARRDLDELAIEAAADRRVERPSDWITQYFDDCA